MKKTILFFFVVIFSLGMQAQEPLDIKKWVEGIDCKSPNRTGHKEIDDIYDQSDKFCKSIKVMGDSVPIYSLKSIVENGDTVAIIVVDQFNKPYNSLSATKQIALGSAYIGSVTAHGLNLASKYAFLATALPGILKSEGLRSIGIIKKFTSHSSKIGKLAKELMPTIKGMYERRGNPIKAYQKAQASLSPDDGFVKTGFDHVPEFDPADMPSDEELDILLNEERNNRSI